MSQNETRTPPATVLDIVGLGNDRRHTTDWTVYCEDVNGGEWTMEFRGFDGLDECDDFAQEIRKFVANGKRVERLGRPFPTLLMFCDYVEASDTYRVRFGKRSIPLSSTTWTAV